MTQFWLEGCRVCIFLGSLRYRAPTVVEKQGCCAAAVEQHTDNSTALLVIVAICIKTAKQSRGLLVALYRSGYRLLRSIVQHSSDRSTTYVT